MYIKEVNGWFESVEEINDVVNRCMYNVRNDVVSIDGDNMIKLISGYGFATTNVVFIDYNGYNTITIKTMDVDLGSDDTLNVSEYKFNNLQDALYISFALIAGVSQSRCSAIRYSYNLNKSNWLDADYIQGEYRFNYNRVLSKDSENNKINLIQKNDDHIIVNKGIESGIIPERSYMVYGNGSVRTGISKKVGFRNSIFIVEREF